jgi:uncharacterized protein (UPF0333 family)
MSGLTRKDKNGSAARIVRKQRNRRGATAMEYLMVLSLIVVFCLIAVGYVGGVNNNNMTGSAGAINKAVKKGS